MKWKHILVLAITGSVVALDQLTKMLIYTQYHLGQSTSVIQNFFNITYVRNYGAAFGFLSSAPAFFRDNFFLIIPPLAMILILYILKDVEDSDTLQIACYGSILAGAIGNYIDRLHLGFVVDFLDFHYKNTWSYPAFNVADIAIVCGVMVLIYLTIKEGNNPDPNNKPGKSKEQKDKKLEQISA